MFYAFHSKLTSIVKLLEENLDKLLDRFSNNYLKANLAITVLVLFKIN